MAFAPCKPVQFNGQDDREVTGEVVERRGKKGDKGREGIGRPKGEMEGKEHCHVSD